MLPRSFLMGTKQSKPHLHWNFISELAVSHPSSNVMRLVEWNIFAEWNVFAELPRTIPSSALRWALRWAPNDGSLVHQFARMMFLHIYVWCMIQFWFTSYKITFELIIFSYFTFYSSQKDEMHQRIGPKNTHQMGLWWATDCRQLVGLMRNGQCKFGDGKWAKRKGNGKWATESGRWKVMRKGQWAMTKGKL